MTATNPDLLADLVEGRTYQLGTSPARADGSGGVRWQLFLFARLTSTDDEPGWRQIATHVTDTPVDGYRSAGFGWLRSMGLDPDAMDLVLILADGVERVRPQEGGSHT